jgi:hypothetical protein
MYGDTVRWARAAFCLSVRRGAGARGAHVTSHLLYLCYIRPDLGRTLTP